MDKIIQIISELPIKDRKQCIKKIQEINNNNRNQHSFPEQPTKTKDFYEQWFLKHGLIQKKEAYV